MTAQNKAAEDEQAPQEPIQDFDTTDDTDAFLRAIADELAQEMEAEGALEIPAATESVATEVVTDAPTVDFTAASIFADEVKKSVQVDTPQPPHAEAKVEVPAVPEPVPPEKKGPVNPLVSARENAAGQSVVGGASGDGLYPLDVQVEQNDTKTFDTTFDEGHKSKAPKVIAILLVLAALAAAAAFFGWRYLQANEARAHIDEAVASLRSTDAVIVPLDEAVSDAILTSASQRTVTDLMMLSGSTDTSISSAETALDAAEAARDLLSSEDADSLDALRAQISARRAMLSVGGDIRDIDAQYEVALSNLTDVFTLLDDAADDVEQGWEQFNNATDFQRAGGDPTNYDAAHLVELDDDALAALETATSNLDRAREAMPSADYSAVEKCIDTLTAYVGALHSSHEGWAAGDAIQGYSFAGQIEETRDAYDAAVEELPSDPAALLASAYMSLIANHTTAYDDAHRALSDSAAKVNEYLGVGFDDPIALLSTKTVAATSGQASAPAAPVEETETEEPNDADANGDDAQTDTAEPDEGQGDDTQDAQATDEAGATDEANSETEQTTAA